MINKEAYGLGMAFWLLLASVAYAENPNEDFQRLSTPVIATIIEKKGAQERRVQLQGTGFFYQAVSPHDPAGGQYQWVKLQRVWLVTNRHVLLPKRDGRETIPAFVTFNLRRTEGDKVAWDPITIPQDELVRRVRLHQKAFL